MLKAFKPLIAGLMFACCIAPAPVFGSSPTEQIQETIQQVLKVVSSPAGNDEERKDRLRETLMPRFDWLEMAKQSLGKHWNSASGRENEFVAAFADFLGNSYVSKIGSYKDEKIVFMNESIENDLAQVKTKIIPGKGEPTSVNYRLHRMQGEWKIYDVVIEDISIVVNFRSQFNRLLAKAASMIC